MTEWTKERPTQPGRYWFYGTAYKNSPIRLHVARVHITANGFPIYLVDGDVSDRPFGWWLELKEPVLPRGGRDDAIKAGSR